MQNSSIFNWGIFLIGGIVAFVYGLLALFLPDGIISTVMTVSGIVVIAASLICIGVSISRKRNMLPWGMLMFESIVMLLFGAAAIIWSHETVKLLIMIIGVWSTIMGIMQLISMIWMKEIGNKGFYILCAILLLIFGVLMIVNPFGSAEAFVRVTGALALVAGIILMMYSFAIRRIQKATGL